jgi:hypothetical protein
VNVLLCQLDGKLPNIALMRLARYHRDRGDYAELRQLRRGDTIRALRCELLDCFDRVYASLIFKRTRPVAEAFRAEIPDVVLGGTGWDERISLADIGVDEGPLDYSDYTYPHSMGFTQRGCRLKCEFCLVPTAEPELRRVCDAVDIWRGDPWPKNLLLLDNDFFGLKDWPKQIEMIRAGGFKVCWNQGLNVRLIGDEEAAAVAGTNYCNDQFNGRALYTAWDNKKDEKRLFRNLETLVRHGVKPDDITVYMLIGFWDGPTLTPDDFYRHARLREFGCRPYPMPYVRTSELTSFQRWVVRRIDCNVSWEEFRRAKFRPERMQKDWPLFATI